MINESLSKLLAESLDFVAPDEAAIEALLSNKILYREYMIVIAAMQDHLLRYSSIGIHSRSEPQESKREMQEALRKEIMTPLIDHLIKNQAPVLRLAETAVENPQSEHIRDLVNRFLDDMADWLNHLRLADKTGDRGIITRYFQEKKRGLKVTLKLPGNEIEVIGAETA